MDLSHVGIGMYLDFLQKIAMSTHILGVLLASAAVGPNSALPNIDHSRGKLVDTIYDLDKGWYTSKSSNRLVKEIYEFWANLSCPDDMTLQRSPWQGQNLKVWQNLESQFG